MTRWNELTVCELVMHDVIGTRDTLDVIKDGECNVPTLIELAESSTHVVPTEDEYQERVRRHRTPAKVQLRSRPPWTISR